MSFDTVLTVLSKEGHEYILSFSPFDSVILPESIGLPVAEVVIATEDNKGFNNATTLFQFTAHIKEYLLNNNVILYCYCDNKEIDRCERHHHLTPQEYRSLLFEAMFMRAKDNEFVVKTIVLTDSSDESHFVKLIAGRANEGVLDTAFDEISKMHK
ncbi:hypothetical protein [Sphingobacterium multivorum]|uniref:hypothetical protein n=1 Tax=Sphingobacterium multivorum TaxID=28454 RepID=UPI0028B0D478|nr:hypothetical protein [Sphingobacterium multivorum]